MVKAAVKRVVKRLIDNRLVYYRVAKGPTSVLLTFDDGPHPEITPKVLDLLDEHGAKAVFFVIGAHAEKEPELVREIHRRGHCIGNHTYSHLNDYRDGAYSIKQYVGEIVRCQQLIREISGAETSLFRPPRGEINLKTLYATKRTGHRLIHWSLEGGEWADRENESGAFIADFVVRTVQPRDIVLLHDDNEKTVEVLQTLLPRAAELRLDLCRNSLVNA